jgi:hypothetical protein
MCHPPAPARVDVPFIRSRSLPDGSASPAGRPDAASLKYAAWGLVLLDGTLLR